MGTLREETRALRLLTQQAVEERAEVAQRSLVSILAPVPGCPSIPTAFTSLRLYRDEPLDHHK